ncbi:MoaD/ThiS family protein [Noviluteimonas gilva]|uniref:Molybdopterin synthase sulfur carrier subunit n=1 Tax=Noviluteimonas gilva TaxID=2682097 RepID=A0A7C9M1A4_9GAMM|nr:MoaD/ThiS family protein [Lysobacter gilvus]MUV14208.1 molybdopterin synthase sulfur carrier subunit [Lysobacter gilvus]
MSARVTVLYFASLRDVAEIDHETFETSAPDLRVLYLELRARYGFPLSVDRLRVAVDGEFARWEDAPRDGSEIAFIPPVSGG